MLLSFFRNNLYIKFNENIFLQVIAHEITHSWTGNLVTNKTWEHFW